MPKIVAIIAVSLIAGFAAGALLLGGASKPDSESRAEIEAAGSSTMTEERLSRLEQIIANEREARVALEDQLQALIHEIERIDAGEARLLESQQALAEERREEQRPGRRTPRDIGALLRNFEERRLTLLIDGGFSEDEARRVIQMESQAQYKAMQAAYDAQRRGEPNDPFLAINGAQSLLRDELGDAEYERYLTAQGESATVGVTQVLDSSPASRAGLLPGDQIVSYNGERVFNVSDLRALTLQGSPGEDVIIEIDRDGVRMQLSLPRGPVGITGSSANIRNRAWWGGT